MFQILRYIFTCNSANNIYSSKAQTATGLSQSSITWLFTSEDMKAVIFLCVQPEDGWLAETCKCLYLWRIYFVFDRLQVGFYFSNLHILQNNACVGSLSSTTVSKNIGYSWIEFSHNQIISCIIVTNQCFGYMSSNYINYLEQRNGFFHSQILRNILCLIRCPKVFHTYSLVDVLLHM